MPSTASPFGLRPTSHPSGTIRVEQGTIATGYAAAIYMNDPVAITTDGSLILGAVNGRIVGSFQGVEYTDSNGKRTVANHWTASTAGTDIVAYFTRDQKIRYAIQSDAAVTQAMLGEQFDWNTPSGNSTTGLSSTTLNVASSAANAGLRLVDLYRDADNAWSDTYTTCIVEISEHQDTADVAAY
ncbi:MAG: hypothetical protein ABIH03_12770 [Pseudomonadota bacterium]